MPGWPLRASVVLPGLDASQFLPLLQRLAELAGERGGGELFIVDEVQRARARPDLELLGNTVQQLERRRGLPVSLAIAGLHNTARHLAQACTFFERQDKVELSDLGADATRVAYLEPLASGGITIDAHALELLVTRSHGYPFAIQLYGHRAWERVGEGGRITLAEAIGAVEEADQGLAINLYEPRWDRLDTTTDRAMVKAIAALAGTMVATRDIAAAVGRTPSQLSVARHALLNEHHVVHTPRDGHLAFDLPGFDRWLAQTQDLRSLRLPPPRRPGRRRSEPSP